MTGGRRLAVAALAAGSLLGPGSARPADLGAGRAKAQACFACHGPGGISQAAETPSLAGQPDQFLQWQLVYFRSGTRQVAVMAPIASALSDADIRNLGAYFSSLPAPRPPTRADDRPELTQAGARLARAQRCSVCHTGSFHGQQAIPRLAGQREDYLLKALRDFKSGARRGGGVAAMPDAVYPLSDDDFKALAHFFARLP